MRVSLFVDPDLAAIALAARPRRRPGGDLHRAVRPRLRARPAEAAAAFEACAAAAREAHRLGLGVNAGHDLDLANLPLFRTLPHLEEVSIGHALMSRALYVGLDTAVREYLAAVEVAG